MAGIFGGSGGAKASPLARAISWLSLTAGFAISFIATPKLYTLSVDWAVTSADLGPFLTWVGSAVWFCIVGLLTMFLSNLVLMMGIMLAGFAGGLLATSLRR